MVLSQHSGSAGWKIGSSRSSLACYLVNWKQAEILWEAISNKLISKATKESTPYPVITTVTTLTEYISILALNTSQILKKYVGQQPWNDNYCETERGNADINNKGCVAERRMLWKVGRLQQDPSWAGFGVKWYECILTWGDKYKSWTNRSAQRKKRAEMEVGRNMELWGQMNGWDTGTPYLLPSRKSQKHKMPTAAGASAAQVSVSKCSHLLKGPLRRTAAS